MTEPLLRVEGVTRRFGGLSAVNNVSLHVDPGEIVAVVGPNGAGKTTLFNLITGQLPVHAGDVWFRGRRITPLPAHKRARLGIARTFQLVRPFHSMNVTDNTLVGGLMTGRSCVAARRHARQVLAEVELFDRASVTASELPLAQRKRLEVARAVATDPALLLLDEVMAGLNPAEIERAVELVRRLVARGLTVLLIEHNLRVVRSLANRVVVLDHGEQIAEGAPDDVLHDDRVVEAYLGRQRSTR